MTLQWEGFIESIELGLEADEVKVGNKNAIFHWIWEQERCRAALISENSLVCNRKLFETVAKVRQRLTDFNVTLNVTEAHHQLDQELQFLEHKVELLTKAETEGWNEHFGEQVGHQINQCLLKIEKALCEVSASQAQSVLHDALDSQRFSDDSALGARCRKKVRSILMESE